MIKANIRSLIKGHYLLFIVIIITQIISVCMMLFSYGSYQNTLTEKENKEKDNKYLNIGINGKENVQKFMDEFPKTSKDISDSFYYCLVNIPSFKTDWIPPENHYYYYEDDENNNLRVSIDILGAFNDGKVATLPKGVRDIYTWGRDYFSKEQIESNEKICYVAINIAEYFVKDGMIDLQGQKYRVVGKLSGAIADNTIDMPWNAIPDNTEYIFVSLVYKNLISKTDAEHDIEIIKKITEIDDSRVYLPDILSLEQRMTWQSMLLLSGLMAVLAGFIICLIYKFLQEEREKNTAVYELLGCTRLRAIGIYMGEMIVLMIASTALGIVIFKTVIFNYAEKHFKYYEIIFRFREPYLLVLAFCGFVLLIMFFMMIFITRKTPKELLRAKE